MIINAKFITQKLFQSPPAATRAIWNIATSSLFLSPQHRNDLRKVLDENEDNFGDIDTTRGSTASTYSSTTSPIPPSPSTSTSTRSSTSITHSRSTKRYFAPPESPASSKAPKAYFSNSFSSNNHNNLNGQNDHSKVNHDKGTATFKTREDIETTTTTATATSTLASRRTINPYYNANRVSTTSRRQLAYFTTTARTPYSFQYYTHSTTNQPPLLTTYKSDENHKSPNNAVETEKQPKPPRSSTYNPVFDVYFKQIGRQKTTTTKRPRSIWWTQTFHFLLFFIEFVWENLCASFQSFREKLVHLSWNFISFILPFSPSYCYPQFHPRQPRVIHVSKVKSTKN